MIRCRAIRCRRGHHGAGGRHASRCCLGHPARCRCARRCRRGRHGATDRRASRCRCRDHPDRRPHARCRRGRHGVGGPLASYCRCCDRHAVGDAPASHCRCRDHPDRQRCARRWCRDRHGAGGRPASCCRWRLDHASYHRHGRRASRCRFRDRPDRRPHGRYCRGRHGVGGLPASCRRRCHLGRRGLRRHVRRWRRGRPASRCLPAVDRQHCGGRDDHPRGSTCCGSRLSGGRSRRALANHRGRRRAGRLDPIGHRHATRRCGRATTGGLTFRSANRHRTISRRRGCRSRGCRRLGYRRIAHPRLGHRWGLRARDRLPPNDSGRYRRQPDARPRDRNHPPYSLHKDTHPRSGAAGARQHRFRLQTRKSG